ncbi:MAG: transposase [Pirellulales bacterium]
MPRPLRPIDDGLIYHVINRGNNRQDVFRKQGDFQAFLETLDELKKRKPFELYGYCLLSNHFHLLIRPTGVSISRILQSLLVSHTQRYHRHYKSGGHVWQGRFKSPVIQDDEHLLTVLRYIEANPLRANVVRRADDYRWSSYRSHGAGAVDERLDRLVTFDELSNYPAVRQRRWAKLVHRQIDEDVLRQVRASASSGLPFGSPIWVRRLADRLGLDLEIRPRGRPRKVPGAASQTVTNK